ncbi:MAG: cell division protein FtsZ [Saprospiraceae bacterium]|nr:cell division protein FtsZ [Saprospiraceae bacterium]
MKFNIPKQNHSIIKVIGVGGGGGNAVAHMFKQGIIGVDFAICNTDAQAMEHSPIDVQIALGPSLTDGRGAGSKPETGKEACIESIDDIRSFLTDGTKMLFVTAGMGGGTGTGAAPIIAKAAKELGILTVGIVTLPFHFEGLRRKRQALEGLENLKKNVDAILVISNDKLKEMYGDLTLTQAFGNADNVLSTAAKSIAEIITVPGYINVDFEDVNFVMKDSGVALMGYGESEGVDRARKAIHMALTSPLLEENDIRGAKHILLNISSGTKEVTMSEIGEITDFVQEEAGFGTDLIWGNCKDEALGERISVTLIATGFETGMHKSKSHFVEPKKVPLDDDFESITNMDTFTILDTTSSSKTIEFEQEEVTRIKETIYYTDPVKDRREAEERQKMQEMETARRLHTRHAATMPLDTPENKEMVEKVPAYKRRGLLLDDDDQIPVVKGNISTTVYVDSEGTVVQTGNSFLRERID